MPVRIDSVFVAYLALSLTLILREPKFEEKINSLREGWNIIKQVKNSAIALYCHFFCSEKISPSACHDLFFFLQEFKFNGLISQASRTLRIRLPTWEEDSIAWINAAKILHGFYFVFITSGQWISQHFFFIFNSFLLQCLPGEQWHVLGWCWSEKILWFSTIQIEITIIPTNSHKKPMQRQKSILPERVKESLRWV